MAQRPRLHKIDADMQRWCARLEEELSTWPDVVTRPMFGLIAYYRGATIFAAIPRTRAAGSASSVLIKLRSTRAGRRPPRGIPGAGWSAVEMPEDGAIEAALHALGRAYENAAATRYTPLP